MFNSLRILFLFIVVIFSNCNNDVPKNTSQGEKPETDLSENKSTLPKEANDYTHGNEHLEGLAPIIGRWEGTITQVNKSSKSFVFIVETATFNNDTNIGEMQGYSTVNGENRTNFIGSWSINGDSWPTMNLEEPSRSPFNGTFSLTDCYEKDFNKYEPWRAICGTWTSYNKSITSNIVLKKVSFIK